MKSIAILSFTSALILTSGINVQATAQEVKSDSTISSSIDHNVENRQVKDSLSSNFCPIFRWKC